MADSKYHFIENESDIEKIKIRKSFLGLTKPKAIITFWVRRDGKYKTVNDMDTGEILSEKRLYTRGIDDALIP